MYNRSTIFLLLAILITSLPAGSLQAQYVLKQAKEQASLFNYPAAKKLYTEAYKKKNSLEAARGMAEIYYNTKDYEFAESWYAKVVAMPDHTPEDELHYAEVLMNNSKYNEAAQQLRSYLEKKDDKRAANMLIGCGSALEWLAHPVKGNIVNMQAFNTSFSDWGLTKYNNKFIFASDRAYDSVRKQPFFSTSNINRAYYNMTGNSYLHLYASNGKDSSSARLLGRNINGDFHSANATFTADEKDMLFAVTTLEKKKSGILGKDNPYTLNVEIVETKWDTARNAWGPLVNFPFNETFKYSVGDPWISPDGQTLYFTSNIGDDNAGGTDIYFTTRGADDKWQKPQNMGRQINTEGNERTPYFDKEGNFYFASDGHIGMGGLDIFKAVKNNNGSWTVTNMGSPVNSPQDDFAPYFEMPMTMYFSSNRLQGKGSDDIYRFDIAKILVFNLTGTVTNKKTHEPLKDAVISLLNQGTGTTVKTITDEHGGYHFDLDSLTDYSLSVVKTDYTSVTDIGLTTKGRKESETIRKDMELDRIELHKPVKLENIYFDLDKWNIRPDAAQELDMLVKLLKDNPTWQVEMSSHTDSRAGDNYNLKLSQRRAEATVKYLVDHGIAPERLSAKGYGETRLVNKCANGVPCTEEEHQQNRRTEFTIIDK